MSQEKELHSNLPAISAPSTMLDIISRAAADPNTDPAKMHSLLDVQERMMNKQAEINFNIDFGKLQAELPSITQDAKIVHSGKLIANYATYEAIDKVIRPLLVKHGFSLRYNSKGWEGKVVIYGTLAHRDGHSITDEIPLGIDASGAKNNVQGVGSTIAYGKRYLVGMLLNLVFCGEDDDGVKAGHVPINDEQATEIKDKLRSTGADVKKFLEYMGAASVDEIAAKNYSKAIVALNRKAGGA